MAPKEQTAYFYGILAACNTGEKNTRKSLELITKALTLDAKTAVFLEKVRDKKFNEAYKMIGIDDPSGLLDRVFRFDGECKQCGKCCRDVMLFYEQKLIESKEEFDGVCKKLPDYKRFVPSKTDHGRIRFACEKLNSVGHCTDYENRPASCSIYPNYVTPHLKEGCGYRMKIEPGPISGIKEMNAVGLHLFRVGLYKECIDLFKDIEKAL